MRGIAGSPEEAVSALLTLATDEQGAAGHGVLVFQIKPFPRIFSRVECQ